jgi:hypothetical protein
VKNEEWDPEPASMIIQEELRNFEGEYRTLIRANKPRPKSNLSPRQLKILLLLKRDKRFIGATDKKLGPFIIEHDVCIQRCLKDHLLNSTHTRLTDKDASMMHRRSQQHIKNLVATAQKPEPPLISKASSDYFKRSYNLARIHRPPQFYIMFKVHKETLKTRHVVSCVGSFPEIAKVGRLPYQLSSLRKAMVDYY